MKKFFSSLVGKVTATVGLGAAISGVLVALLTGATGDDLYAKIVTVILLAGGTIIPALIQLAIAFSRALKSSDEALDEVILAVEDKAITPEECEKIAKEAKEAKQDWKDVVEAAKALFKRNK